MPDRETTARLLDALEVRRNVLIGLGVGILVAALAFAYRVGELGGPVRATRGSPELFVLLAFVLAISLGGLVTVILTVRSAVRLARDADSGADRGER